MHRAVLPHAVAGALDVDHVAAMQHAVEQRAGHHLVAEHRTPLLEPLVGGEDRRAGLVAGVHQLEEQPCAVLRDRQVADLVHHQQRWPEQQAHALAQRPAPLRDPQLVDQFQQRGEMHAAADLDGGDRQRDGQMGLADARRAAEHHVLVPGQEVQLVQARQLAAIHARLQREVVVVEGLEAGQPRGAGRRVQPTPTAQVDLRVEQSLKRFADPQRAAVGTAQDRIQGLQRAGASSGPPAWRAGGRAGRSRSSHQLRVCRQRATFHGHRGPGIVRRRRLDRRREVRASRQGLQAGPFVALEAGTRALAERGAAAAVGGPLQPAQGLRVEIVVVEKLASVVETAADVVDAALHLPLGLRPMRPAGADAEAPMRGEVLETLVQQQLLAPRAAVGDHHRLHLIEQHVLGHAAEVRERMLQTLHDRGHGLARIVAQPQQPGGARAPPPAHGACPRPSGTCRSPPAPARRGRSRTAPSVPARHAAGCLPHSPAPGRSRRRSPPRGPRRTGAAHSAQDSAGGVLESSPCRGPACAPAACVPAALRRPCASA